MASINVGGHASAMDKDLDVKPAGKAEGPTGPQDLFDYLLVEFRQVALADGVNPLDAFVSFCQSFFRDPANRLRGYSPVTGGMLLNAADGRQFVIRFDSVDEDRGNVYATAIVPKARDERKKQQEATLPDGALLVQPVPKHGRRS